MSDLISQIGQNYRRAFASSNFGTHALAFYSVYTDMETGDIPPTALRIDASGSSAVFSDGSATELGSSGMTHLFDWNPSDVSNPSIDDEYVSTGTLPFDITFLGQTYSEFFIGSNSYLTFGGGSTEYNLNNNPQALDHLPALMISAADNSYQYVFSNTSGSSGSRKFTVRFEGDSDNGGPTVPTPSNMVWEVSFYENLPGIIDLVIVHLDQNSSGLSGITNGTVWADDISDHTAPLTVNNSFELWSRSNSLFAKTVRAIQQVVELYYVGTPDNVYWVGGESQAFTFAISENNSGIDEVHSLIGGQPQWTIPTKIQEALNNANINGLVIRMEVGPYSIYVP